MNKIPPVAQHYEDKENNFRIEKDPYIDKSIVWEVHKNYSVDRIHGTKKECEDWVKKHTKKKKRVK